MFVHTAHGPGRVVDEQSVRGRKSFLVEGSGFKVWVDERDLRVANEVNHDNSTTLPYDPTPQHPAEMFGDESTIQPDHEIDPDEILSASDSLTFDDAEEYPYPGPSADNFAKQGGFLSDVLDSTATGWDEEQIADWVRRHDPDGPIAREKKNEKEPVNFVRDSGKHSFPGDGNYQGKHRKEDIDPSLLDRVQHGTELFDFLYNASSAPIPGITAAKDDEDFGFRYDEEMNEDPEYDGEIKHFSSVHEAIGPAALLAGPLAGGVARGMSGFAADKVIDRLRDKDPQEESDKAKGVMESLLPSGLSGAMYEDGWQPGYWPSRTAGLYERPAGLSDKYIRVEAHVDHYSDPAQQFRDDPVGFIQKRGYMMSDSTDIRLAEYVDLVESDSSIRTAAWRDVRSKALRLRREGRVHVKDIAPDRIYANVDGDSDTYETMIVKGAGNNQSISDWHCSCPWGRWAFKRQMSYVGRLCSHGYASYLEMESQQMKDVNKRRKSASIIEDFKQWADNENDGMIDQGAIDNYIYLLNSQHDGDHTVVSEDDAEKLYDALDDMKSTGMVRDFDVDYLERPGDVYKDASFNREADVLAVRPQSLTPDFYFVEDGKDGQSWTDVTKDDRKTTGPDNMIRSAGYFGDGQDNDWRDEGYYDDETDRPEKGKSNSGLKDILRLLLDPHTASRQTRRLTGRELHYASDEELGHAVKDWASAGSKLEKLRDLSAEGPDFGNMRDRNDEIREVIDELHDRGIDAAQFVASLRFAADAEEDAAAEDDKKKKPPSEQGQPDMSNTVPSQTGVPGGSSSIEKPESSSGTNSSESSESSSAGTNSNPSSESSSSSARGPASNDLANQTNDPASVGFGGAAASPGNRRAEDGQNDMGLDFDGQAILDGLGQAAGGFMNALPSIMQSVPSVLDSLGQIGGQIGSGLSGLTSGIGDAVGNMVQANNQHTATPIGGFPNVQFTNQESFQGSGPNPKYWFGSSECYVDEHERERFVDVTDLDDDPIIKYTGDKPKQGPGKKASGSRRPFVGSGDNKNPATSTLTSGDGINDTTAINLDQPFKSGAVGDRPAWDGHRVRDFRRYVKQNGGRINHQMLQEYLSKPRRGLDQGGRQHLQEFTSYAEQHEELPRQASIHYAEDESYGGIADVPGSDGLMPEDPEVSGILASNDRSDIVTQFHRMGGIEAINNSGGGGSYSDSAIAEQARGFLRTAGRHFSLAEQRELEEESHPSGARNLKDLDLKGTHYEDAL